MRDSVMKAYNVKLTPEEQTILLAYKELNGSDVSVSLAFGMALRELRDCIPALGTAYENRWGLRESKR